MRREVRVGVVGCGGFMSRTVHLPVLTGIPGVRLAAVCDARGDAAEEVATRHGAGRWTTEPGSVLGGRDVDAVVILTPPWEHARMAATALAAGKSVFAEKPLCLCSEDALDLTTAALDRELMLQVGYMKEYDPICALAYRLIHTGAGRLGDLRSFDVEVRLGRWREEPGQPSSRPGSHPRPAPPAPDTLGLPGWVRPDDRSTYFTLLSAFSHDLHLLAHLLRRPLATGSARFAGETDEDVRSIDVGLTAGDATGTLHLAVPRPPAEWRERFLLTFTSGTLELLVGAPLLPDAQSTLMVRTDAGEHRWVGPARDAFRRQLHAFVSRVRVEAGADPGASYVGDLRLAEQIYARSRLNVSTA